MYITADTIKTAADVIGVLTLIIGGIIAVYKVWAANKKQTEVIRSIQSEQRIIVKALKGALEGLVESGCNGPCKKALKELDDYINEEAHKSDI